jgi:hypothetical protein
MLVSNPLLQAVVPGRAAKAQANKAVDEEIATERRSGSTSPDLGTRMGRNSDELDGPAWCEVE